MVFVPTLVADTEGLVYQSSEKKDVHIRGSKIPEFVLKWSVTGTFALRFEEGCWNVNVVKDVMKVANGKVWINQETTYDEIVDILNSGASHIIVPESFPDSKLKGIPKERVIVHFSADLKAAGSSYSKEEIHKRVKDVKNVCSGFVISLVDGFMELDTDWVMYFYQELKKTLGPNGAICTDSQKLDILKRFIENSIDVHLQNQLLEGSLDLGHAIAYSLVSDRPDGLFSTVVTDEQGVALGLVYSSTDSIVESIKTMKGVYNSRKRGLWHKGETSGAIQYLKKVLVDCDRDCLNFVVEQKGAGFCHLETRTCFGPWHGIGDLARTIEERNVNAEPGSYTRRLLDDKKLLHAKILEEAEELVEAKTKDEVAWECADVIYFALVKCISEGVPLAHVERELKRRSLKISRRKGDAKGHILEKMGQKRTKISGTENENEDSDKRRKGELNMSVHDFKSISQKDIEDLCRRPAVMDSAIVTERVKDIMCDVRKRGDEALIELTKKFDKAEISCPVLKLKGKNSKVDLPVDVKKAIDLAFDNIYNFHKAQMPSKPLVVETVNGVTCSRVVRPIEKVGLYVPGGSAVLPSTALMLGIPALVAGCKEVVIASPPRADGSVAPEILYIASKVKASMILLAGGAQAIAAMAYGTESVPKVDKICGPGNAYVTSAKMIVQNDSTSLVSIDMPAGPSEVLVVADIKANPAFVASDLLSQAEHGPDSQVVLVTIGLKDKEIDGIVKEVRRQVATLPRKDIAKAALAHSFVVKTNCLEDAISFSNIYAPEHLICNVENFDRVLEMVTNAGSVFLGPYSAESCGDYASGTNHTLPTYGYAKMYSGVSTSSFLKFITSQHLTEGGLQNIGEAVATLAGVEGLDAHKRAVLIRLDHINNRKKTS
eukprot:Nk52_evm31s2657 gene=Nk52_evmTU31s2657